MTLSEQLVDSIIRLGQEYPDFVYRGVKEKNKTMQYYTKGDQKLPTGECGCIIGIALLRVDSKHREFLEDLDTAYVPSNAEQMLKRLEEKGPITQMIRRVQICQDKKKPWSRAIKPLVAWRKKGK